MLSEPVADKVTAPLNNTDLSVAPKFIVPAKVPVPLTFRFVATVPRLNVVPAAMLKFPPTSELPSKVFTAFPVKERFLYSELEKTVCAPDIP